MSAVLELIFRHRFGRPPNTEALVRTVQQVFTANGVDVRFAAGDASPLPNVAMDRVSVGSCRIAAGDHLGLFEAVAAQLSSPPQLVVFIVGSIEAYAAASGCAAHPEWCTGVVITETAASGATGTSGKWVLAHEVGHLLGLDHVRDASQLMCDPPTGIAFTIPRLSDEERRKVTSSRLLGVQTGGSAPIASRRMGERKVPSRHIEARSTPISTPGPRRRTVAF